MNRQQDCSSGSRFHYGYVILFAGILTVMGALGFARFGYATILPDMKAGLLLNNTQMGLIATGNLIGYTAFSLLGGFFAARYGPRHVIAYSMLLAGAAMFFTGTVGGVISAVVLRFVTGLGSAGGNIPVMGLVSAWFAPKRRGIAAGVLVGGSGLSLIVTGLLVPRVIALYPQNGWRISWYLLGGIVCLLGVIGFTLLRNSPAEKNLSPLGACGSSSALEAEGANSKTFLWRSIFKSKVLWHLGLVYLFFGFSYIIYGTFFVDAMMTEKGFTQAQAGAIWSFIGFIAIFSGILWGAVSDFIGRKFALAIVFGLQAVCYFLFAAARTPEILYLSAFLYGLTAFSIPGIVAAACGDYVGARLAPAALGMVTLFFAAGQTAAPSVAGFLADKTHTFSGAFILAAAVAVLGSAGSLTLTSPGKSAS
ncbi:MAG: MFS transporter [Dethiobacter sp.]|jgi:sugar phosphate permease|nr:MFS transporter [Dethiobacter sp.]